MFIYSLIVFAIFYSYLQFKVIANENSFIPSKSDALIILGHSLLDGEEPDEWLIERLQIGLKLYQEGYATYIIVTGGKGSSDKIPVSVAMKNWFIQNGVPEKYIIVEDRSRNTNENFKFIEFSDNEISSILVVTNDFHMYRSMKIANHYFDTVSGSSANTDFSFRKMLAYLKEPLSLIKVSIEIGNLKVLYN